MQWQAGRDADRLPCEVRPGRHAADARKTGKHSI
jgi:hypothetical protein